MAAAATLEIRSWSRAVDGRLEPVEVASDGRAIIVATDFGPELDKRLRHVNVPRRDPWFFRAAETCGASTVDKCRPIWYDRLLQLFVLADLEVICGRFKLGSRGASILLTAVPSAARGSPAEDEIPAGLMAHPATQAALQSLRLQCIAGNSRALLRQPEQGLSQLLVRMTAGRR